MSSTRRASRLLACLVLLCATTLRAHAAGDVQYVEMQPPFVVNVGSTGRIGYLQTEVSLRTNTRGAAVLEYHMPLLRHEMIMLLSRQSPQTLNSPQEREALRLQALDTLRSALAQAGPTPGTDGPTEQAIEDLLFTSFIIQR